MLTKFDWLPNLVLRVTVGFMFFSGAFGKLSDTAKFAANLAEYGVPFSHVTAPVLAVVELVGGLFLALGLFTRTTALVLAAVMVGALLSPIAPGLWAKHPNVWYFLSNLFYSSEWLLLGILAWVACVGDQGRSVLKLR
ncbi:DoxX family protein [Pseudonocardiaceae bacterium YIM PH 21723]|nr:DoxX family protein [Pseudonocardiaceae bacterium YIM PH 21723]